MRYSLRTFCRLAAGLLLAALSAGGQIHVIATPGEVEGDHFVNRSMGVEYTFPEGWTARVPGFPSDRSRGLPLLTAAPPGGAPQASIALYAISLARLPESEREPHRFLTSHPLAVRGPANAERVRKQLAAPVPLEIFSRPFERIDWQLESENGAAPADAFETQVAGSVNGQMLVLFVRAASREQAEELAETADSLRFAPPEGEEFEDAPDAAAPRRAQRVSVPEEALRARLRNKVEPVYPREALAQNVEGDVLVTVVVGTDGRVREAGVLSGHPLLAEAALAAVRQWTFTPYQAQGVAVEAETTLRISFRLRSARQAS